MQLRGVCLPYFSKQNSGAAPRQFPLFYEFGQIFHEYIFDEKTFPIKISPISCLNDSETKER